MNKDLIQGYYKQFLTAFVIAVLINCGLTWIVNFISPELLLSVHEQYPNLLPLDPVKSNSLHFGVYSPLISRLQLSNLISIAAVISAFLFLRKYLQWFQILSLALLLLYSVSFGGRGGQLGLLAGLGVFSMLVLAFYKQENQQKINWVKYFRWALPIVVLGMSAVLYNGYEPIQKRYQQLIWELQLYDSGEFKKYDYQHFTSLRRIVSWQNTYKVIKDNLILGVGIGDYNSEMSKVYASDDFELPVNNHNQYLTFAAIGGIIALLIFLGAMLFWLIFLKQQELYLFIFGLAFLITYGVIFIFDAALYFQVDRFLFTLLFGLIPFCKK